MEAWTLDCWREETKSDWIHDIFEGNTRNVDRLELQGQSLG